MRPFIILTISCCVLAACGKPDSATPDDSVTPVSVSTPEQAFPPGEGYVAYTGAAIWDGTGSPVQQGRNLIVQNNRVVGLSPDIPDGAEVINLQDKWIVPGFVNTHGHVSGRWADDSVEDPADRVRGDLSLYARYGITTVVSLGGAGPEAFTVRDEQKRSSPSHARLKLAGAVVAGNTSEEAVAVAKRNLQMGVDWIKIRVDDNLGNGDKMPWDIVHDVINVAREAKVPVATHIFYMEDAQRLLEVGTGLIAHSVRDQDVSTSFTQALIDTRVCYVPTLTREVSTFVYASRPAFFDDPFFLEAAKQSEIDRVSEPEFMAQVAASPTAAGYKQALEQAKKNLKIVADSGASIAFGTDSGPGGRFLGYFEHMEFELMSESGMTPEQILLSATSVAAKCVQMDDVGTLAPGKWADFVVLAENPLEDIRATRSITDVYISGNPVIRD